VLGIIALASLFLKLPETPNFFGLIACKTCSSKDPYLPLVGAGYFATLVAVSLLFPSFPRPLVARGGLTWSVLLAAALTYINLPYWCGICLFVHACHIAIWTIWAAVPICAVAFFSCLNLTFMAYGFKAKHNLSASALNPGDPLPAFTAQTSSGRIFANTDAAQSAGIVINFISPSCLYSQEQLPVLNDVAAQLSSGSYRFINVSSQLSNELVNHFSSTEWVEDKEGKLRELFKVYGYPTLFVVGKDGKIARVIPGAPEKLKAHLMSTLVNPNEN
jgi:thiol-disulfide isomerase/thioredoxin